MVITPGNVVEFWLNDVGPKGWYAVDEAVDTRIRSEFGLTWEAARDGQLEEWRVSPEGVLGYLIVTDQFPRNMFRGRPDAFDTDPRARSAASAAIDQGWDMRIAEPERQFFYLPFMHSENLADQDRAVGLYCHSKPLTGGSHLVHARAHREIIRRFGRFPFRNAALGRTSVAAETAFLDKGGYLALVREMQAEPT